MTDIFNFLGRRDGRFCKSALRFTAMFAAAWLMGCSVTQTAPEKGLDPRLIGKWQGLRDRSPACEFMSWNSEFRSNGSFEISFFADAERKRKLATERGTWKAANGRSELKTRGVPTPEVYEYTFIDKDTVRHVNTVKDPSADCQADYEFVEKRRP